MSEEDASKKGHQGHVRVSEKTARNDDRQKDPDRRIPGDKAKPLQQGGENSPLPLRRNLLPSLQPSENNEKRQEGRCIEKKAIKRAPVRQRDAGQKWTEHARQIELKRVHGDGVGEIPAICQQIEN